MAYQQTNATSVDDLINKIAAFAVADGWTQHRNTLAGVNRTLTLQKGGDYIHVYNTDDSNVRVNGSVNYDSAAAGSLQPNQAPYRAAANVGTGPFPNVFFFGNSNCVFVVVEIASGIFRHLCFGLLAKQGAYTGGTFFDAHNHLITDTSNWSSLIDLGQHHRMFDCDSSGNQNRGAVRCDLDGYTSYFAPFCGTAYHGTPVASGGMGSSTFNGGIEAFRTHEAFYDRSVNGWTGVTPIQPIKIRVERPSGYWSELGEVPAMRFLNMARFQPGDEFSIGPDTWKVFPVVRKGYTTQSQQQYSSDHAFAYLKTV